MSDIKHSGFYSYLTKSDTPAEYYTTVQADEVIFFLDGTEQRYLNSLLIENCGTATMYVRPINSDYVICIPTNESRNIGPDDNNLIVIPGIQVLGVTGQKIRYSGLYS